MKHLIVIISVICLFDSCISIEQEERFNKIYGDENSSEGKKILALQNGDYLLLGKIGVPAFNLSTDINDVVVEGPGFIRIDKYGNQLDMRTFPIERMDISPFLSFVDITDKAIITDAIENPDGSILAVGNWLGVEIVYDFPPSIDTTIFFNGTPFIMRLQPDLSVDFIKSINGGEGWDLTGRFNPVIERSPSGRIYVLFGFRYIVNSLNIEGYTIREYDQTGDILRSAEHIPNINPDPNWKFAREMTFDDNGNIVIIGQRREQIALYRISEDDLTVETGFRQIDQDGQNGFNNNPMFVSSRDDGSIVGIYTDAPFEIKFHTLNDQFQTIVEPFDIDPNLRDIYPRSFKQAQNGDFLLLAERLVSNNTPICYAYRISPTGNIIFKREVQGLPGDIDESPDGDILIMTSPIYNQQLTKINLIKMSADGKIY